MKDKKVLGLIGGLVLILVGVGAFLIFGNNSTSEQKEPEVEEEVIPSIAPSELGFEVKLREDQKAVMFSLSKLQDIKELEYEIIWDAVSPEDDSIKLNRSSVGSAEIEDGAEIYESDYIDLGSCSTGKCRFDIGVTKVNVILKITKSDGKIYQSEKSVNPEE